MSMRSVKISTVSAAKPDWRRPVRLALAASIAAMAAIVSRPDHTLAQDKDPYQAAAENILRGLKVCSPPGSVRVRVAFVGFEPDDLSLDEAVAAEIRRGVEERLARLVADNSEPFVFFPIRDMGKMLRLIQQFGVRGSGGTGIGSGEAPFDLAVFAKGIRSSDGFQASFTVQRVGDPCSYPAGRQAFEIGRPPVHDPEKVMRKAAYEFFRRAEKVGNVVIEPVEVMGESAKGDFRRRLNQQFETVLIQAVRGGRITLGDDKSVKIRTSESLGGSSLDEKNVWKAQLFVDLSDYNAETAEMTLKFSHPDFTPYVYTYPVKIGGIKQATRESVFTLSPAHEPFAAGQRLGFRFRVRNRLKLYCLLRFGTQHSIMVYPTVNTFKPENTYRTHEFDAREREYVFPSERVTGFRLFTMRKPATYYLHCFAATKAMDSTLHRDWLENSPRRRVAMKHRAYVEPEVTQSLLRRFRSLGGVEEQVVQIKVVKKD